MCRYLRWLQACNRKCNRYILYSIIICCIRFSPVGFMIWLAAFFFFSIKVKCYWIKFIKFNTLGEKAIKLAVFFSIPRNVYMHWKKVWQCIKKAATNLIVSCRTILPYNWLPDACSCEIFNRCESHNINLIVKIRFDQQFFSTEILICQQIRCEFVEILFSEAYTWWILWLHCNDIFCVI